MEPEVESTTASTILLVAPEFQVVVICCHNPAEFCKVLGVPIAAPLIVKASLAWTVEELKREEAQKLKL